MFNLLEVVKNIWIFLDNYLSVDSKSLREDARKVGIALILSGIVGYILNSDKISSSESVLLFIIGLILWVAAILTPSSEGTEDGDVGG